MDRRRRKRQEMTEAGDINVRRKLGEVRQAFEKESVYEV